MASTQKKTTKGKQKSGQKKTGNTRKKRAPVYMPNLLARTVGGIVCLFFALLVLLGMCGIHALVPDLLCRGIKGLVGYGFWTVAAVLVGAALLLFLQRERSVCLRLWCMGLLPVLFGALFHMILAMGPVPGQGLDVAGLWSSGTALHSGGVLSGLLSIGFVTLFSKIGAGLLFCVGILLLLGVAFRITPARVLAYIRKVMRPEDDGYEGYDGYDEPYEEGGYEAPYPEEELPPPPRSAEPFWPLRRKWGLGRRRPADIPLDEGPSQPHGHTPRDGAEGPREKKQPFFDRNPKVKRPDEVLQEQQRQETAGIEPEPHKEEPAPPWPEEPIAPPEPAEPTRAQQRDAIRREAEAVSRTIEQSLEEERKSYVYPPLTLLTEPSGESAKAAHEELEGTLSRLSSVLASFGIDGHVTGAVQGPSVTRYEVALEQGVRLNKLTNLSDDVALALGVSSVRIAPVPGKISVVGIEVPNSVVIPVPIREVLDSPAFRRHKSSAAFSVGKDIGGNYIVGDCAKLPHMLIAGTTGSGKSVCINSLIVSMLYKSTPEELRLIMVDPKMVELGGYNGIPHLLIPVVTDPKKAAGALQWAVTEMMKRYRLFAEAGVRELSSYNVWAKGQENATPMPKIVIVIDELADLMLVAAKEVEESICRVAQMGRAAGMHLVIATQRPSADVITGLMKANIPSRIAFAVASSLESRIILDNTGAEKLVGKGDMLWFPLGSGKPLRVQGCFISDEEVAAVVDCVKQNSTAEYDDDVMEQIEQHVTEAEKKGKTHGGSFAAGEGTDDDLDEVFPAAVDVILELGQASVSMLQRRLKLGYARAARLVDQMEERGIVGPFEGSKPRQLLITKEQWLQMQQGGTETGEAPLQGGPPPVEEEILTFDPIPQERDPL